MVTDHHQIVMASTLIHAEQCIAGDLLIKVLSHKSVDYFCKDSIFVHKLHEIGVDKLLTF